jgi:hypothetical protein
MSWKAVEDELMNLETIVKTMEEEQLHQEGLNNTKEDSKADDKEKNEFSSEKTGEKEADSHQTADWPPPADPRPSASFPPPPDLPPPPADLPVSRLLDELRHFDREKNLRKVKIEISMERRGWRPHNSHNRRLSESSLEVHEAARQKDNQKILHLNGADLIA